MSKAESILLWSSNLLALGSGMMGPLYAVFAQNIGGDVFELTWVYALYLVVMGVGMILAGKVGDRVGHEYLSILGYAIIAAATFGYFLVHSITGLLVVQICVGVGMALQSPTWSALYDRYSGAGDHDGYVWGLSYGLWYVFQGVSVLTGGYIVTRYSFDILFVVMGTLLVLSTLIQAQLLRYRGAR